MPRSLAFSKKSSGMDQDYSPNLCGLTTDQCSLFSPAINGEGKLGSEMKIPQFFKVILIGDCNVGKTSIIQRLTRNTFTIERVPTTSVDEVTNFLMPIKQQRISNNEARVTS